MRLVLIFVSTLVLPLIAGEEAVTFERNYKLKIDSEGKCAATGIPDVSITAHVELTYRRECRNNDIRVFNVSKHIKTTNDGALQMETTETKDRYIYKTSDKNIDIPIARASDDLKKHLHNDFEVPTVAVSVNNIGHVVKFEPPSNEDAKSAAARGLTANVLFFHRSFSPDEETWTEENAFGGPDSALTGTLTYKKGKPAPDTPTMIPVEVSGKLKGSVPNPHGGRIPVTMEIIFGTQTYDTALKQWRSGRIVADIDTEPTKDQQKSFSIHSSTTISMTEEVQAK